MKKLMLSILFCFCIYSCKSQEIHDDERNLYTLKNYQHCLFYNSQTSKEEGIDLRKLDCSINYQKKYFSNKSRELLLKTIKKRYTDEYISKVSKKRVLLNSKLKLEDISKKLKDSTNFMYRNRFNRRLYNGYEKQKKELEGVLLSQVLDTFPKYKRELDDLYNSLKRYKISNTLIYAVAFVEEKERAILFLKELLKDTIHVNVSAIKLSLAKLKVEPYYTNQLTKLKEEINYIILNKNEDNSKTPLMNIRYAYPRTGMLLTKEAILIYSKVLEAKYFDTIDHGDVSEISIPARTLSFLFNLIDNYDFKEYFKDQYGYPKSYLDYRKKDIQWAIEWLRINKSKLKINDKHIPSLHEKL